jgi:hypothetical protein
VWGGSNPSRGGMVLWRGGVSSHPRNLYLLFHIAGRGGTSVEPSRHLVRAALSGDRVLEALGADMGLRGLHRTRRAVRQHHSGRGVEVQHLGARANLSGGVVDVVR